MLWALLPKTNNNNKMQNSSAVPHHHNSRTLSPHFKGRTWGLIAPLRQKHCGIRFEAKIEKFRPLLTSPKLGYTSLLHLLRKDLHTETKKRSKVDM
jgi:hypothetical protein